MEPPYGGMVGSHSDTDGRRKSALGRGDHRLVADVEVPRAAMLAPRGRS